MATYLITQATGGQAQSVIQNLLAADDAIKIHAVVRDISKVASDSPLRGPRITLFEGESVDEAAILAAARGCAAAFLNTFPIPGVEEQQARGIVGACRAAGVGQVVATTTFTTGRREMWDDEATRAVQLHGYFTSKRAVEDVVRGAGLQSYTILRPAVLHFDFFLPNSPHNYPRLASHGVIDSLLAPGRTLPFTDADTVGRYAAAALREPARFAGAEIDLAGEMCGLDEARDLLVRVSGRPVTVETATPAELQERGLMVFGHAFQLWANIKDLSFAPALAKEVQAKYNIPFTSLEESLQRDKAKLLGSLPAQ